MLYYHIWKLIIQTNVFSFSKFGILYIWTSLNYEGFETADTKMIWEKHVDYFLLWGFDKNQRTMTIEWDDHVHGFCASAI